MTKQKIIGMLLVAFIGLSSFFYLKNINAPKENDEIITIGAILPETNKNYASYASQLKKGMLLAEEIINNQTNKSFQIIFEDGFGTPSKSISAFNKLKDFNDVNFIIGPMFSNTAESLAPISLQKKIILLSPSASSIALTKAGKYFFRIYPSDSYDGIFLASFINSQFTDKKIAIVNENTSSINQIVEVFKKNVNNNIVLHEPINSDNSLNALGSIIVKLKELKPDIIFFPGNKSFMSTFLKKRKEQNIDGQFITISTFNDKELVSIAKEAAEGVLFSTPSFDVNSKSSEMLYFVEKYENKHGELPDILAGYGYDVVNISYLAVKDSINNTDGIISNLHNMTSYKGVTGNAAFDVNGDIIKELQMMIVKNGQFLKYE